MKNKQSKSKVEELCINLGGEDYCPDYWADKITCDKCPKLLAARKNESAVATVAAPSTKHQLPTTNSLTDQDVAAGITRQLQVIEDAEKNAQLERVKLGVVLIRWEQYLGKSRGGRGKSGDGLKGWLSENVPNLSYDSALSYKKQANQAVEMLGGGAKAQAVLLDEPTVTQPDGEVVEIEADYVEKRDKIFENVKSRRQLEQTYFAFMASEGKRRPGRPKGSGAGAVEPRAKTAAVKAAEAEAEMRELIGRLGAYLTRGGKVGMLTAQARDDFHRALVDYAQQLAEMM